MYFVPTKMRNNAIACICKHLVIRLVYQVHRDGNIELSRVALLIVQSVPCSKACDSNSLNFEDLLLILHYFILLAA